MKLEYELIDDSQLDEEDLQVERDANLAAVDAIHRCRRFGTAYVIWEEDQVKEIPPDKTPPYEERLLTHAAKLNRRIEELQAQQSAAALNDRAAAKS